MMLIMLIGGCIQYEWVIYEYFPDGRGFLPTSTVRRSSVEREVTEHWTLRSNVA
jgi:hypothetical protein